MDGEREPGTRPAGNGESAAPRTLSGQDYEDLRRRIAAAVRRNCPSWLRGQAEDIVQSVLVKLLKAAQKSEGKRTFSSVYLEKSAYGALVDEIRRACRRREGPLEGEETSQRISSGRDDPERRSSAREIGRGILDCLSRLSRPRKLAVSLYLNGCTVPEAAAHLRWHLKRTESLVYRGLADLRRCLERKGLKP